MSQLGVHHMVTIREIRARSGLGWRCVESIVKCDHHCIKVWCWSWLLNLFRTKVYNVHGHHPTSYNSKWQIWFKWKQWFGSSREFTHECSMSNELIPHIFQLYCSSYLLIILVHVFGILISSMESSLDYVLKLPLLY